MINNTHEEMKQEAREDIINCLENGFSEYYADLHNEVFNTDYYTLNVNTAKRILNNYDVFEAIEKVQTYEKDNFGEVYTDLSDPIKIANMLYYIIGDEVLYEMMDGIKLFEENWDNEANEETNALILAEIKES